MEGKGLTEWEGSYEEEFSGAGPPGELVNAQKRGERTGNVKAYIVDVI